MYVCEPVLRMIEPVQCLWTCVMYMSHCYVYEPLLCLWTSVMDMKQCYLCEKVLCIWASAMWTSVMYEPLLCLWTPAFLVNQGYTYLWWWQCGFLSVWQHHRPSSGTEKHNSTTWCPPKRRTKKYPVPRSPSQNLIGKQDVKVAFSGGYWDCSQLGIQGIWVHLTFLSREDRNCSLSLYRGLTHFINTQYRMCVCEM